MSRWTLLLLALGIADAHAQSPMFDPAQLPAFRGRVAQYSLTARDEIDGLILEDGTEVRISPRLSAELAYAVKPGDQVTVHGLKASGAKLVQAISIRSDAGGATVEDQLSPGSQPGNPYLPQQQEMEAKGRVKMPLHAPNGEFNGVLLEDGTIVRLSFPASSQALDCFTPGKAVTARGVGLSNALGRVLETRQIALDAIQSPDGPAQRGITLSVPSFGPRPVPLLNPPMPKVSTP